MAIILCMIAVPFSTVTDADSIDESWDDIINDNTIEACYTTTDTIDYSGSKVNASLAVGAWNCFWNPTDHVWQYDFNISGMGASGLNVINGATIDVTGPSNSGEITLYDKGHSKYSWSVPSSDEDEIEEREKVSQLLFDILLAMVPVEDAFEDIWTIASDIVELVGDGCDDYESGDNNLRYSWEWSPNIDKTAQQVRIVAELGSAVTQSFTVEYTIHGGFGSLSPGTLRLTMSSPTTEGYPDEMTAEERDAAGIRTIQKVDILEQAEELSLTSNQILQLISSPEDEFYYFTSEPVCEIITDSSDGTYDYQTVFDCLNNSTSINEDDQAVIMNTAGFKDVPIAIRDF